MGELDWRERPMMSPLGGFLIQNRAGDTGNYEVVIAWPDGGLAHFWRENDNAAFPWHGPAIFGSGEYIGATVVESDFRFVADNRLGNLEVLATRPNGTVESYWRENGGQFLWKGPFNVFDGAGGAPSMAYTGAYFRGSGSDQHGGSSFYVVVPNQFAGFAYWQRRNGENGVIERLNLGGTGSIKLAGIALTLTTIGAASPSAGYKYTGPGGQQIVVGVSDSGSLRVYVNGATGGLLGWMDRTVFGRDIFPELDGEFFGRPCVIQGDFGYDEISDLPFSGDGHLGNLELMVPSKRGGLLHFWRDCGVPRVAKPIHEGWSGPARIPGPLYDEVSIIQSNFSSGEHGNLEMIARRRQQRGFDFFFRDEGFTWHGPQRIGAPLVDATWHHGLPSAGQVPVAAGTTPTSWSTTPGNIQHIAYVGTDQLVHECFFRIGGTAGWEHNVPSASQVPVAAGTSPTSWYTTPENIQHIAYVGTDQQIHECFYFIGGENIWLHNVPSAGNALVAPGTSPTSWCTTPENIQHIAYVGTDQLVHECFFRIGGTGGWEHNVPSAGQVPVAAGTSPTSWYTTPENIQHIAYVGTDQLVHECFYRIGGTAGWEHNVPSAGQVPVAAGTSPTSWYTTPENIQHVAYVGTDQQIHECFFFVP